MAYLPASEQVRMKYLPAGEQVSYYAAVKKEKACVVFLKNIETFLPFGEQAFFFSVSVFCVRLRNE